MKTYRLYKKAPKRKTCQACLDNPNIPEGQEHQSDRQLCGVWLCRSCDDRITALSNGVSRLRALAMGLGKNSLVGLLNTKA